MLHHWLKFSDVRKALPVHMEKPHNVTAIPPQTYVSFDNL